VRAGADGAAGTAPEEVGPDDGRPAAEGGGLHGGARTARRGVRTAAAGDAHTGRGGIQSGQDQAGNRRTGTQLLARSPF